MIYLLKWLIKLEFNFVCKLRKKIFFVLVNKFVFKMSFIFFIVFIMVFIEKIGKEKSFVFNFLK